MIFSVDDIVPELDYTLTPQPDLDAYWWRVNFGPGEETGWVWVPVGLKPPSREWIAREMTRLEEQVGTALAVLMRHLHGMELEPTPGPDRGTCRHAGRHFRDGTPRRPRRPCAGG